MLVIFIENARIWTLPRMATFEVWTAKTETFENADVSHIIYACANERCCISLGVAVERFSVIGENASKMVVWTRSVFVENASFHKRIAWTGP